MNNYDEIERKIFLIKNYLEDNLLTSSLQKPLFYNYLINRIL